MTMNLIFFTKGGKRKNIAIDEGVTIVGRRPDCDIRIPLLYVSRKHCRIIRQEEKTIVQDLGSANGTFLNNERIMEAVIGPGDRLGVGSVMFTVQIDGQPEDVEPPARRSTAKVAPEEFALTDSALGLSGISETMSAEEGIPSADSFPEDEPDPDDSAP
ncbi:MAG: FHA domain-containing protein [Sedimentisphaerales bacterium]|nr:FHA domain-containing protein [Sedimentisphaerales bacterium]